MKEILIKNIIFYHITIMLLILCNCGRRNTGINIIKKEAILEGQYVIPYNFDISNLFKKEFDTIIMGEAINKYQYKYFFSSFIVTDSFFYFNRHNEIYSYNIQKSEIILFETLDIYNSSYDYYGIFDFIRLENSIVAKGELHYQKSDLDFKFRDSQVFIWSGQFYKEFDKFKVNNFYISNHFQSVLQDIGTIRCKVYDKNIFVNFSAKNQFGNLTIEKYENGRYSLRNINIDFKEYFDLDIIYLDSKVAKLVLKTTNAKSDIIITVNHQNFKIKEKVKIAATGNIVLKNNPITNYIGTAYTYHNGFLYRMFNTSEGLIVDKLII